MDWQNKTNRLIVFSFFGRLLFRSPFTSLSLPLPPPPIPFSPTSSRRLLPANLERETIRCRDFKPTTVIQVVIMRYYADGIDSHDSIESSNRIIASVCQATYKNSWSQLVLLYIIGVKDITMHRVLQCCQAILLRQHLLKTHMVILEQKTGHLTTEFHRQ